MPSTRPRAQAGRFSRVLERAVATFVLAAAGCSGGQGATLPEEFLGQWYYVGSSGGITGKGLGDAAAGYLVIRADGTLERHGEDGALTETTRTTATRGRTIFSEEEQWMLTSEGGVPEVIRLSADGQTMTLAENVHDGFSRSFARSR